MRCCGGGAAGLALALALLAACDRSGSVRVGSKVSGGRLVTATVSDPKTFNPVLVTDVPSSQALSDVFEGLVRTDPATTLEEPLLAERWEWSDDGKVCTFALRRDVRWHDGVPFTAADVAFTFAAIFDPAVPNSAKFSLTVDGEPIRVEVVDEHTVRFLLPRPFAPFLSSVGVPILPAHILAPTLAQGAFARTWGVDTPPEQLVGTGPYRMRRYVPAQLIEYERNPDYWMRDGEGKRLPYIAQRTALIVPDRTAVSLRFLSGQTHFYEPQYPLQPEEIANLIDRSHDLGIEVRELGSDPGNLFVAFNRNPRHYAPDPNAPPDPRLTWFTDPRFLRALAHAVDKQGMIDTIFYGFGTPAVAYISEENKIFHDPEVRDYPYDLELAAELLGEAGYRDRDGDGWREDERGNRLEFGLMTNAGNPLRERMCSILREDWTKLGIKVNYRPQTFQAMVERLNATFEWDAMLIGFTGSIEPNNGANFLRSSGNLHMWNPAQKTPATPWEAEIDKMLDAGAAELDPHKRAPYYFRIQQILHDELPFIETVRQKIAVAYSDSLRHFDPTVWGLVRPERIDIAP